MSKIKRPTLATTKNCIMILKEADAEIRGGCNTGRCHDKILVVLTMLTNDESWMEK